MTLDKLGDILTNDVLGQKYPNWPRPCVQQHFYFDSQLKIKKEWLKNIFERTNNQEFLCSVVKSQEIL